VLVVVYDIGIEKWYDSLKEHTFETEWLSLSRAEAGAIVKKCESTQVIGKDSCYTSCALPS
jgi:hypothetical protein